MRDEPIFVGVDRRGRIVITVDEYQVILKTSRNVRDAIEVLKLDYLNDPKRDVIYSVDYVLQFDYR